MIGNSIRAIRPQVLFGEGWMDHFDRGYIERPGDAWARTLVEDRRACELTSQLGRDVPLPSEP